ncbi:MAG: hypothetical protein Faunusvirus1_11 [Faunusvirus sp.]|uniref:Uncharacterized protein n=1 Tax=Faunusvirus sp. TaxID=2487766 RepID=A0A3G4ZYA5_9VIRU|nr:MAG: hypothetical protein Faunusvirus1_11 [Faunusvirus sp.]
MNTQPFELIKLRNEMETYYNKCVVSGNTNRDNLTIHSIIPSYTLDTIAPHLIYSKYNNILLTHKMSNDLKNYKFVILPEPIKTFYNRLNYKIIKGGVFKVIPLPSHGNCETEITLLYNCQPFLKWQFIKFMEYNGINPARCNVNYTVSSDRYLYNTINKIGHINTECVYDKSDNPIIYEKTEYINNYKK